MDNEGDFKTEKITLCLIGKNLGHVILEKDDIWKIVPRTATPKKIAMNLEICPYPWERNTIWMKTIWVSSSGRWCKMISQLRKRCHRRTPSTISIERRQQEKQTLREKGCGGETKEGPIKLAARFSNQSNRSIQVTHLCTCGNMTTIFSTRTTWMWNSSMT